MYEAISGRSVNVSMKCAFAESSPTSSNMKNVSGLYFEIQNFIKYWLLRQIKSVNILIYFTFEVK